MKNIFKIILALFIIANLGCSTLKEKKDLEKKLPHNMVKVTGGSFQMGSSEQLSRTNEKPQHQVTVSDFNIGKYEITFEEFDKFCIETNRKLPKDKRFGRGKRPVIMISLRDIYSYCNWLSEKEGLAKAFNMKGELLDKDGNPTTDLSKVEGYRLPSEAEWEYAAKGGINQDSFIFSGTNSVDESGWYDKNADYQTHEVGQKLPNSLGLYDMNGNVWEWCLDYYKADFYAESPKNNPLYFERSGSKIARGGSYISNHESLLKNTFRFDMMLYQKLSNLGFRLAKTTN